MSTDDFLGLKSFKVHKGNALLPNQIETAEWLEQLKHNDQVYFKLIEARDLGMHRGYFKILAYIYDRLPLVFNLHGRNCLKCGTNEKISIDHIIPVSKGGKDETLNLQPLCRRCNSSKGSKIIDYRNG